MPKQVHYIRDFSGGVNSQRSPRDINENQSPFSQDVMGDRLGSLRTMGGGDVDPKAKNHSTSDITLTTLTLLFQLSTTPVAVGDTTSSPIR